DLPRVQEKREADVLFLVTGQREEELEVGDEAPVAADHVAVEVLGAQGGGLEGAHRAYAARVEVLEEGERLPLVPVGIPELDVEHGGEPRQVIGVRVQELALVRGAVVREVAGRHANLDAELVVPAARGPGE